MPNRLLQYDLDKLAQRVERSEDSNGQKAEPILIARSMIELQNSIIDLKEQILSSSGDMDLGIKTVVKTLTDAMNRMNEQIKKYSESSNKHANAIKYLTAGLVFVGIIQIVVSLI